MDALDQALAALAKAAHQERAAIRRRQAAMIRAHELGAGWIKLGKAAGIPRDTARDRYHAAVRDLPQD